MIDGNKLREEFGRYLAEHKSTRWGMDAALMHVCKIAYDAGKADGPGAVPREEAIEMSEYLKEAERLLSEYGDAVSDAVVFAQDPSGYSMRMEEATRAALLAHIQRGAVPEGWQLVPKEPTPEMLAGGWGYWLNVMAPGKQRDTAAKEYTAMLAAAPAPSCTAPAPAEVPMPEPVAYGFGNTAITGHTNRLMMVRLDVPFDDQYAGAFWLPLVLADEARTYGAACRAAGEAAGYARGRVVEKALRGLLNCSIQA